MLSASYFWSGYGENSSALTVRYRLFVLLFIFLSATARADYKEADKAWNVRDYQRVLQSCQKDAEAGEKFCQNYMGALYRFGVAVERSYVMAAAWLLKSANQGNAAAQVSLGALYRDGQGVKTDLTESIRLVRLSAEQGHAGGLNALGAAFENGQGVERNTEEAFRLYTLAAEKGNASAQSNLASMYRRGVGTSQNLDLAFAWAQKSSKQNNGYGHNGLGLLYRDGLGTPQNYTEAIRLFKLAVADRISPQYLAYTNLGLMFAKGIGVPKDVEEAKKWLSLGAEKNVPSSKKLLQELASTAVASGSQANTNERASGGPSEKVAAIQRQDEDSARSPAERKKPLPPPTRKALVMGNDSYQSISKLQNARADAKAISDALSAVGYAVRVHVDLDERSMKKALRDFTQSIVAGDEVVFFYAGHGVQLANSNYLLPTDLVADDVAAVKDGAIPLQRVLDDISDAKAKLTVAIIDACRDNPFRGSGRAIGGRGLAPTSAATGQLIMFSAGSGQQALDKVGPNDKSPNGLFTRTFLKYINKKGETIDRIMRQVRQEVVDAAKSIGHEQVPSLYDQVVGDFYFAL